MQIGKLFLIAGIALATVVSCDGTKKNGRASKASGNTENDGSTVIAYYDQEKLSEKYAYYREQDSIMRTKQMEFQQQLAAKQSEIEQYYNEYARRAKNNELSPLMDQQYQQNLQQRQQQMMNFQQTKGARLEQDALTISAEIHDKVEKAAKKFCEENGYDMLISKQVTGQVMYINPSMDVTSEFVDFLNDKGSKDKDDDNEKSSDTKSSK